MNYPNCKGPSTSDILSIQFVIFSFYSKEIFLCTLSISSNWTSWVNVILKFLFLIIRKNVVKHYLFFQIAKTKQYFGIFEFIDDHYYFGKLDRGRLSGVVVPIRK